VAADHPQNHRDQPTQAWNQAISLVRELDNLFLELQRPFDAHKSAQRKNFLNYNYVFCRLLQKMGCKQFCMFFPLIKSSQKLQHLDEMWDNMAESLNWPM
jgi:hypothetical protein